jgi:predicted DNA-binding protein
MEQTKFYLPSKLKTALQTQASTLGITASYLTRTLVEAGLKLLASGGPDNLKRVIHEKIDE